MLELESRMKDTEEGVANDEVRQRKGRWDVELGPHKHAVSPGEDHS